MNITDNICDINLLLEINLHLLSKMTEDYLKAKQRVFYYLKAFKAFSRFVEENDLNCI